ncbi:hypothetical protein ACJIZ3_020165 [Penstemon smallii]|uniref:ZF-HD dimerization-type domain-containing protein n=1 Tax=Penstemon smallii TaxID=265156 RepID=A0ABD3SHU5_9LAMI
MANNYNIHGEKVEIFVVYKECVHNHAARARGYVIDGCGQFLASGPNGTTGAMLCGVCGCHRNFHKRVEVELPRSYIPPTPTHGDQSPSPSTSTLGSTNITSTTTAILATQTYQSCTYVGQSRMNRAQREE